MRAEVELAKCVVCKRYMWMPLNGGSDEVLSSYPHLCAECYVKPLGHLADTPMPNSSRILPKRKRPVRISRKMEQNYVQ